MSHYTPLEPRREFTIQLAKDPSVKLAVPIKKLRHLPSIKICDYFNVSGLLLIWIWWIVWWYSRFIPSSLMGWFSIDTHKSATMLFWVSFRWQFGIECFDDSQIRCCCCNADANALSKRLNYVANQMCTAWIVDSNGTRNAQMGRDSGGSPLYGTTFWWLANMISIREVQLEEYSIMSEILNFMAKTIKLSFDVKKTVRLKW